MFFPWWPGLSSRAKSSRKERRSRSDSRQPFTFRPWTEALEDRTLLSAGNLDPTFGPGTGKVTTAFGTSTATVNDIALQSDGKIIAVGSSSLATSSFALARYNTDGSLDTTFGSGGKVT